MSRDVKKSILVGMESESRDGERGMGEISRVGSSS